jgi:RNA polymerase sigma-70 factor (ECF subfamily)
VTSSQATPTSSPRGDLQEVRDEELVDLARAGNASAFDLLVQRHWDMTMAMTRRIAKNPEDVEDIVQQSMMKAFAKIATFEGRSTFSTWLISIARNQALMLKRSERLCRTTPLFLDSDQERSSLIVNFPDASPSPEVSCAAAELKKLLASSLQHLKPDSRVALQLCDIEERSIREVALELGISEAALKSRRVRGRRKLAALIRSRSTRVGSPP